MFRGSARVFSMVARLMLVCGVTMNEPASIEQSQPARQALRGLHAASAPLSSPGCCGAQMFQDSTVTGSWVRQGGLSLEITCRSEGSQSASLWFPGMDHHDVSALADQLAQCTCQHLPWSDQRVIAIELGVGECDLAIDDMVRGAVHRACPVPDHIIARLHEWLDGYDATACTNPAQLRSYVNRLRSA